MEHVNDHTPGFEGKGSPSAYMNELLRSSSLSTASTCSGLTLAPEEEASPVVGVSTSKILAECHHGDLEATYQLQDAVLGSGASGDVRQAVCKQTGRAVAVKTYSKPSMDDQQLQLMRAEMDIHASLPPHSGIVRLESIHETEETAHLVFEKLEGGELFERVVQYGRFSEGEAADLAWQLLNTLSSLHTQGVVHRDIKPDNIMYQRSGGWLVKLIDFGCAAFLPAGGKLHNKCGTLQFAAPELLSGQPYDDKVDMWSLGSVMHIALTGLMPFSGDRDTILEKNMCGHWTTRELSGASPTTRRISLNSFCRRMQQTGHRHRRR